MVPWRTRAPQHAGLVSAAFPDDRFGFARHHRLIDEGGAPDDVAVNRDRLAGPDLDRVPDAEDVRGDHLEASVGQDLFARTPLRICRAVGLGPSRASAIAWPKFANQRVRKRMTLTARKSPHCSCGRYPERPRDQGEDQQEEEQQVHAAA